jgi:hypothetical protein
MVQKAGPQQHRPSPILDQCRVLSDTVKIVISSHEWINSAIEDALYLALKSPAFQRVAEGLDRSSVRSRYQKRGRLAQEARIQRVSVSIG